MNVGSLLRWVKGTRIPGNTESVLAKRFSQQQFEVEDCGPLQAGAIHFCERPELELRKVAKVLQFQITEKHAYTLSGRVRCPAGRSDKAGVLQFCFLNSNQEIIPGKYSFSSYSEATGNYVYLPSSPEGNELKVTIVTPPGAVSLLLGVRCWDPKVAPSITAAWKVEDGGPYVSVADYEQYYEDFFQKLQQGESDMIAFLFASTKLIGHSHRGNRSMRFAWLMAQRGIPVLFNYYRWHDDSDMVAYDGGCLFQSPIDLTVRKMVDIATHPYSQKQKLLLLSFPNADAVKYIGLFRRYGWTIIYECRDDWEEFWLAGAGKWYHPLYERYVTAKADAVVTVSCTLAEKMAAFRLPGTSPPQVIPNGLEPSFLRRPTQEFLEGRRHLQGQVIVGYHGHLTGAWFDWGLIIATAQENPEWRFEVIGFDPPTDLLLPDNMAYLGPKSHEEINEIAQNWTVGIIPFVPSKLAQGVDPIKVYEYLALGLPVVSVLMPQILEYPFVYCYHHREEFAELVRKASETPVELETIEGFLSTRTWEHRIDETLEVASRVAAEKAEE